MTLNEIGQLYSIDKVAQCLNVEEQTVRKWIKEGKLPSLKLAGTTLRVSEKNLEKFILHAFYWKDKK